MGIILLLDRIGMRVSCFSEFNLFAIGLRYLGWLQLSTGLFFTIFDGNCFYSTEDLFSFDLFF